MRCIEKKNEEGEKSGKKEFKQVENRGIKKNRKQHWDNDKRNWVYEWGY